LGFLSEVEVVVPTSRARFALLCLSQFARALADGCFYTFVVLQLIGRAQNRSSDAWGEILAVVTMPFFLAAATIPFVVLAPVNGAVCNNLPRRWLLVAGAGFCLCVTILLGAGGANPPFQAWAIVLYILGVAIHTTARSALLPSAAADALLPLTSATGWIQASSGAGIGVCLLCCVFLVSPNGPVVLAGSAATNLLAAVTALAARFPSDTRKHTSASKALTGFFLDAGTILRNQKQAGRLLGQGALLALLVAVVYALLGSPLGAEPNLEAPKQAISAALGFAVGSLLVSVQEHPRRALGLLAYSAFVFFLTVIWAALGLRLPGQSLTLAMAAAVMLVPLRCAYLAGLPADGRGNGAAVLNLSNCVFAVAAALLSGHLLRMRTIDPTWFLWAVAGLAAAFSVVVWWVFLREALEQLAEVVLWPFYRVRAHGPGRFRIPANGPLLVIANHTAWFDPLWLAKLIPRSVTPMMTSKYYDLPILHWLMVRVARAIRVPAGTFRREAPELAEAVTVLDRGGCLVIFPEGFVKRREELPLRNFGQGVWRILSQRPETPVMVCWIEGGWGSYTSHYGSPPMTNKKLDRWRPIDIAIEEPRALDRELLADQRATRSYLMRACLEARRHLGLKPFALVHPDGEERCDDEGEEES
jgi:1-acyl-sn-glycerol-3-phosphate acyltransferase